MGYGKRLKLYSEWRVKSKKTSGGKMCRTWWLVWEGPIGSGKWGSQGYLWPLSGFWLKVVQDMVPSTELSSRQGVYVLLLKLFTANLHILAEQLILHWTVTEPLWHTLLVEQIQRIPKYRARDPHPLLAISKQPPHIQHYFPSIPPALIVYTTLSMTCLMFVTIISLISL